MQRESSTQLLQPQAGPQFGGQGTSTFTGGDDDDSTHLRAEATGLAPPLVGEVKMEGFGVGGGAQGGILEQLKKKLDRKYK